MNTTPLNSHWCISIRQCYALFAVLLFVSSIRSEDRVAIADLQRIEAIPVIHEDAIQNIGAEQLQPWIDKYHSLNGFKERNKLVFRLTHRGFGWPQRMSLVAFDPKITPRSLNAVVHLASAHYTKLGTCWDGSVEAVQCLTCYEPRVVAGYLRILRSARELRPDGSDREWPATEPLDPKRLPKHIATVLKVHPILAIDVAQTLEVYGPFALKEAGDLLPLLLSKDEAVVDAAQSAILKMDPLGLAKLFHLENKPMTPIQKDWLRDYFCKPLAEPWMIPPVYDMRESDGTPQSESSQRYEELRRFMRYRRDKIYQSLDSDKEIAFYFRDHHRPGDWWGVLNSAYLEQEVEFGVDIGDRYLLHFASALYDEPGSQVELIRLLHDENPRVAGGALNLIAEMRLFKPNATKYTEGDLVDPEVLPLHILKVIDRHPHLCTKVAWCLSFYGRYASTQAEALVPFLQSDDSAVVQSIRAGITAIAPDLAQKLEITFIYDHNYPTEQVDDESVDGPAPLTFRQQELIKNYFKGKN